MKAFSEGLNSVAARVRQFDRRGSGQSGISGNDSAPSSPKTPILKGLDGSKIGLGISPLRIPALHGHLRKMTKDPPKTKIEWRDHLMSTEQTYCDQMQIFNEHYARPIMDDSKGVKPNYFARQDFQKLVVFFTNVEALLTLNNRFLELLKTRNADDLGDVLSQYAPLFQMYGQYASDFEVAEKAIIDMTECNEKFSSFLADKKLETGKDILELMKMPLDRLESYSQIAGSLHDLCPSDDALLRATVELNKTAALISFEREKALQFDRLKQLSKMWAGIDLMAGAAFHRLVREGELDKFSRRAVVSCRFLLFDDALVYGVPTTGDKVKFKRSLPLATMVVEDTKKVSQDMRGAFDVDDDDDLADSKESEDISAASSLTNDARCFFILTPLKSFKVRAPSEETKDIWISELRDYIEVCRRDGAVASSDLKPVWVPDVQSKACMRCQAVFTMIRRRHHCRRCGVLCCQACSRTRMTCKVPAGKDKTKDVRVRVCDDCAKRPPSVRFSLNKSLKQALSNFSADQVASGNGLDEDDEDEFYSDDEGRALNSGDLSRLAFDETTAAPQQGLSCIVIQARPVSELNQSDEVELNVGDNFLVEEINAGWAVGTNLTSGKYGYAPANHMQYKDSGKELPEDYVFDAAAAPAAEGAGLKRRVSSSSLTSSDAALPASPRGGSSIERPRRLSQEGVDSRRRSSIDHGSSGRRLSTDNSARLSTDGSSLDGSERPSHRRNRSSLGDDEPKGIHRRSGSGLDERRNSAAASLATPPSQLLTFSDKRSLIMNEIVITERSYLSSLNALLTVFLRPLIADYKTEKPQLGGDLLGVINEAGDGASISVFISRLELIVTLNSKLASDLEARLAQWTIVPDASLGGNSPSCTCGDVFVNYGQLFNIYDEYSSSYEFATKTLVDRGHTDAKLSKFLEERSEANAVLLKQQSILSLLIMPIQRVPRYLLLLKEMLKNTPESHPDQMHLDRAISTISQVASHINEQIRERENMVALRDIDQEFGGTENLTDNPSRVFKHRGDLIKRSRKTDGTYHFWLFSDILLYQKKAKGLTAKSPKRIVIKSLTIIDVPDSEKEAQFAFDLRSQAKSFRVFAGDQSDKEKWMRALQEAVEEATGGQVLDARNAAPVWEQDTTHCAICEAKFTFIFRRHHCRACGKCVCDRCSLHRMRLPNVDDTKELRVCNDCYDTLSGPSNSASKRKDLSSAIASAVRRTSGPSVPALSKASSIGFGGSKRAQADASMSLSPRAASAHAAIVDARQIVALSSQMAERRRLKETSASDSQLLRNSSDTTGSSMLPEPMLKSASASMLSGSLGPRVGEPAAKKSPFASTTSPSHLTFPRPPAPSKQRPSDSSPLPNRPSSPRRQSEAGMLSPARKPDQSPLSDTLSPLRKSDSGLLSPRRASVLKSADGVGADSSTNPQRVVTKDNIGTSSSDLETIPLPAATLPEQLREPEEAATATTPERRAMGQVLQQIKGQVVVLEAPKPMGMHELPKPLPLVKMVSPAQLSPASSPKVTMRSALPPDMPLDAPSPLSSGAATPGSLSSATPVSATPNDLSDTPNSGTVKPPPPPKRPSPGLVQVSGSKPTKSSPLAQASSRTLKYDGSPSVKPSLTRNNSSERSPKQPPDNESGSEPAGSKPRPPPIPKRRPSSTGSQRSLSRTESGQSTGAGSENGDKELFDIL